ncbi:putative short-chain dehydrogenases/reductase [Microthyrium microscopicum]|uniref:Putative short-chain dehydrogenases/reductase n=1 Tax=Microthyrium microscopicum TaxID=703497 RepID=A0A6A6UP44_9PEZI|nr:putative short-chain dehydrogenases/reductase [Microthyrium microscopicum]
MVALHQVVASNERITSTFPGGLVAVFIGGTSGVGKYTLTLLAKYSANPRIYLVGRSEEAAVQIIAECKQLNSAGTFIFIKSDISLLKNVDDVCQQIKSKETAINILFQSQSTMAFKKETREGLPLAGALALYSRLRFIINLLPLLQNAHDLRRVVSVGAATCEGEIDTSNILGRDFALRKWRDQAAACMTLLLEQFARKAPTVSFVHNVPGIVKTGITRDAEGLSISIMNAVVSFLGPLIYTPPTDCGERHAFLATSAMYPPREVQANDGVPLEEDLAVARGSDGKTGSGVYTLDNKNNSSPPKVEEVLALHRSSGTGKKVWDIIVMNIQRITDVQVGN